VIRSFRHKGLEASSRSGSKAGIQPEHAAKLRRQLGQLDAGTGPRDMDISGWRLHALKGDSKGRWAVWVDANWRLSFAFEDEDAVSVNYEDYH
jgi:proteic killer suppression protein